MCPDYGGGVLISEGVLLSIGFNGVELDLSLLERCPLFGVKFLIMEEVSSFQRVFC